MKVTHLQYRTNVEGVGGLEESFKRGLRVEGWLIGVSGVNWES